MDAEKIWVDVIHCTGCGDCVEACPAGAITLADGKAIIDHETCTGCEACVDACPEKAIEPVIQGEIVRADERRVPAVHRPSPLAQAASTAVVVAGAGLLLKAMARVVRVIGRWIIRQPITGWQSSSPGTSSQRITQSGRQTRHRWRGG